MDLQITLVGLNHRSAGVDIRETFSLSECAAKETWPVPDTGQARESLILSTCNRVEILAVSREDIVDHLLGNWAAACKRPAEEIARYAYKLRNDEAVRHVFNVAASLDSMVIGEPQILGQLKAAYRRASENGKTAAILNRLMHSAFHAAKRVRHETAVASNAVSVSYAAVELAKRIFGAMSGHRAMLIGAGDMAELAAAHLVHAGIDRILIANRTFANAEALASQFQGQPIRMEEIVNTLPDVDIVIASTGSKEPLLNAEQVRRALRARKNRPMFFIDIAVPRDIDPDVNTLDNVYLYDIDDLRDVVEENLANRKEEARRAEQIVNEEADSYLAWLESLQAKPAVLDLIRRADLACEKELATTLKRLGPVSPEIANAMKLLAKGVAKRLNHEPIMYMTGRNSHADQTERIAQVRRIFNLDQAGKCS